jgi:menaquinol-cytochrome c reductase iron-sulfur subunit
MAGPLQNDASAESDGSGNDAGEMTLEPPRAAPPSQRGGVNEGRRGALKALVAVGGAAYAGAIVVPAARMLAPSGGGGEGRARWIRVGRLADLSPGEPRRVVVVGDERDAYTVTRDELLGSVWLLREGDKVSALSAVCPHLGCSIDVNADKKSFACPCHTSKFSLVGEALSGPSPRAMDPLVVRVVEGFVEIDFRRYRQGVAERKEIG